MSDDTEKKHTHTEIYVKYIKIYVKYGQHGLLLN